MNDLDEYVIIAANPKSGRASSKSKVNELAQAISSIQLKCEIVYSLDAVRERSLSLHAKNQLRAVVSAGGDGTADALANLLPADIPILLFPLGTENLLAKYLGLTGDIRQACETIKHGNRLQIDVGRANGKLFLVMLSCGFDAEVVRHMHSIRRGHINRWSYTLPILNSLRKYRFPQLPILPDARPDQRVTAAWVFVFNVPRYAASLDFCPQADPLDGLLDVCTFQRSGIAFGFGYLSRLFLRSHQSMRGFRHQRCAQLVIESPVSVVGNAEQDIPFQIDGDPGGTLPLKIDVLPKRLTLLQPGDK